MRANDPETRGSFCFLVMKSPWDSRGWGGAGKINPE